MSKNEFKPLRLLAVISMDLVGFSLIGVLVGKWVSKALKWPTWTIFFFAVVGFVCGFWQVFLYWKKNNEEEPLA